MLPFIVLAAKAISSSELMKTPGAVEIMRTAASVLNESVATKEKEIQAAEARAQLEKERTQKFVQASETIGKRIEQVRKLKNLTQEQFADACGISRTALRNIEQGQDSKLSSIFAVSEALEIPLIAIFQEIQGSLEKTFAESTAD